MQPRDMAKFCFQIKLNKNSLKNPWESLFKFVLLSTTPLEDACLHVQEKSKLKRKKTTWFAQIINSRSPAKVDNVLRMYLIEGTEKYLTEQHDLIQL